MKAFWLAIVITSITVIGCLSATYFVVTAPLFSDFTFKQDFSVLSAATAETLEKHVTYLSTEERATQAGLNRAIKYIESSLTETGIPAEQIKLQEYTVDDAQFYNIIVTFSPKEKLGEELPLYVVGAHYDTHSTLPGADDNASGVAGLLEIARILNATELHDKKVELVFYSREELPGFGTENMGSYIHAERSNKNQKLVIVLEMIGYYSNEPQSQRYPSRILKYLYPATGNFIAVVSNVDNWQPVRSVKERFASYLDRNQLLDVVSINAPTTIPGIGFSDHSSYWKFSIPAVMISDTAFYRNTNYHTEFDTAETLDYVRMAEVTNAVAWTVLSY